MFEILLLKVGTPSTPAHHVCVKKRTAVVNDMDCSRRASRSAPFVFAVSLLLNFGASFVAHFITRESIALGRVEAPRSSFKVVGLASAVDYSTTCVVMASPMEGKHELVLHDMYRNCPNAFRLFPVSCALPLMFTAHAQLFMCGLFQPSLRRVPFEHQCQRQLWRSLLIALY